MGYFPDNWFHIHIEPQEDISNYFFVKSQFHAWKPSVEWCRDTWGDRADSGWLYNGQGHFWFRDEEKFTWFRLKWA